MYGIRFLLCTEKDKENVQKRKKVIYEMIRVRNINKKFISRGKIFYEYGTDSTSLEKTVINDED